MSRDCPGDVPRKSRKRRPRRKTRMTPLAETIRDMADQGMTSREIAKVLGRNWTSVARCARWHGIRLQTAKTRAYRVTLPADDAEIVVRLSGESGLPASAIIARIVAIMADDGIERARRRLGKAMAREAKR